VIRWLRDWGPALLWAGVIFYLSAQRSVPVPAMPGVDKVFHFVAYLLLGITLAWGGSGRGVTAWLLVLMGLAYGVTDELHQLLVPGRIPSLLDWLADAAGTAAGVALCYPLFSRFAARGSRSRLP
jgi:VanZ family protein